jgi:hypothetical protein
MNMFARLLGYFAPLSDGPSVRDHRTANIAAAKQLVQAERDYWNAFYKRATTQEERWTAIDEIERLDCLERRT